MTPERWKEIQAEPHVDHWFCSDHIKGIVQDLLGEVRRLKDLEGQATVWYERWSKEADHTAQLNKTIMEMQAKLEGLNK